MFKIRALGGVSLTLLFEVSRCLIIYVLNPKRVEGEINDVPESQDISGRLRASPCVMRSHAARSTHTFFRRLFPSVRAGAHWT